MKEDFEDSLLLWPVLLPSEIERLGEGNTTYYVPKLKAIYCTKYAATRRAVLLATVGLTGVQEPGTCFPKRRDAFADHV